MERKERKETEWAVQAEKEVWPGNLKPGLEDTHQIRQSSSLVFSGANFMGFAVKNLMPSPAGCKKVKHKQAGFPYLLRVSVSESPEPSCAQCNISYCTN